MAKDAGMKYLTITAMDQKRRGNTDHFKINETTD